MLVDIGSFKGVASPFDLIKRILEAGEFSVADTGHEPGLEERIIGEMNDEEKALRTAVIMISDTGMKLTIDLTEALRADPYGVSIAKLRQQNFLLKEWIESVNGLFWATLKGRYAEEFHSDQNVAIGLCSGFRVSVLPAEEDPLGGLLTTMLLDGAITRAFGGMRAEKHDCANCADYGECDHPDKKSLEQIASERAAAAGTAS